MTAVESRQLLSARRPWPWRSCRHSGLGSGCWSPDPAATLEAAVIAVVVIALWALGGCGGDASGADCATDQCSDTGTLGAACDATDDGPTSRADGRAAKGALAGAIGIGTGAE